MLDLEKVDLGEFACALEDNSLEANWMLDPQTGEIWRLSDDLPPEEFGLSEEVIEQMVAIEPVSSGEGYGDMEDFIARVADPRARDLLSRAIEGRGAFRRFKDTLLEFPELREAWFAFHDARNERRAIEWLRDEGLVDPKRAEPAIAARPDPDLPALAGAFDPFAVAQAVADDLRRLYGDRLRHVVLFGSWARGDAHPDSDIDLLVVLDRVESSWEERRRMESILSQHSFDSDTVIAALPVSEDAFAHSRRPVLATARREGQLVA